MEETGAVSGLRHHACPVRKRWWRRRSRPHAWLTLAAATAAATLVVLVIARVVLKGILVFVARLLEVRALESCMFAVAFVARPALVLVGSLPPPSSSSSSSAAGSGGRELSAARRACCGSAHWLRVGSALNASRFATSVDFVERSHAVASCLISSCLCLASCSALSTSLAAAAAAGSAAPRRASSSSSANALAAAAAALFAASLSAAPF